MLYQKIGLLEVYDWKRQISYITIFFPVLTAQLPITTTWSHVMIVLSLIIVIHNWLFFQDLQKLQIVRRLLFLPFLHRICLYQMISLSQIFEHTKLVWMCPLKNLSLASSPNRLHDCLQDYQNIDHDVLQKLKGKFCTSLKGSYSNIRSTRAALQTIWCNEVDDQIQIEENLDKMRMKRTWQTYPGKQLN